MATSLPSGSSPSAIMSLELLDSTLDEFNIKIEQLIFDEMSERAYHKIIDKNQHLMKRLQETLDDEAMVRYKISHLLSLLKDIPKLENEWNLVKQNLEKLNKLRESILSPSNSS